MKRPTPAALAPRRPGTWVLFLGVVGLLAIAASCVGERSAALGSGGGEPPSGPRSAQAGVPAALRAAYVAAVQADAAGDYLVAPVAAGFRARSAAQGLVAELGHAGVTVTPDGAGPAWTWQAAPSRWGCDGDLAEVAPATPEARGNRVDYRRAGLSEWYLDGPLGLEQGFTLPAPPACRGQRGQGVVIELRRGGLDATLSSDRRTATLHDGAGRAVLHYSDLYVVDAAGQELPARLDVGPMGIAIRFDDREAVYPVTVDPLIWAQQAELLAADGMRGDELGCAVAISGDTAVVGALAAAPSGAAYVFVRAGQAWSAQAKLTASDAVAGEHGFGVSVAISGDSVVVGAEGTPTKPQGAAYVFGRSGGSWSQQQELAASDGAAGDELGNSVAISGDTLVVGATRASGLVVKSGAAYVFVRSLGSWSEVTKLIAADGATTDDFGYSVALDGDTVVVGAVHRAGQGAAYVFVGPFTTVDAGPVWPQQLLTPVDGATGDGFGVSVAISGDPAIVGENNLVVQNAAYAFVRSGSSWSQQQKLTPSTNVLSAVFGSSVAINGDTAVVGAYGTMASQGAAYVFVRSSGSWSQQQELTAGDGVTQDWFGFSVAVDGDTAVVGALGKTSDQGALYVFSTTPNPGDPCSSPSQCTSDFCVDSVCCSVASCPAPDACHTASTCQAGTGVCSNPPVPDGTSCPGGSCFGGQCDAPCSGGTLAFSPAGPAASGTAVTLTGGASCGGTAEYEFWMEAPGGGWSIVQPYGASSTYAWSTSGLSAGTYDFEVWVRNQGSAASWETYQDRTYVLAP